jgi:hypothetical protein
MGGSPVILAKCAPGGRKNFVDVWGLAARIQENAPGLFRFFERGR